MANTKEKHEVVINGSGNLEQLLVKLTKMMGDLDRAASRVANFSPTAAIAKKEGSTGYAKAMEAETAAGAARSEQAQKVRNQRADADEKYDRLQNELNPSTTPESRKNAETQRRKDRAQAASTTAAAKVTAATAAVTRFQDVYVPKQAHLKTAHARKYGSFSTVEGQQILNDLAEKAASRREAEEVRLQASHGGMDVVGRRTWRQQQTQVDRASKIQHINDLSAAEGMTPAEKKASNLESKKLTIESLKLRKDINRERKAEAEQAKLERIQSNMGGAWMGMLPGGRMLGMAQRMVPGAAGMAQGAAKWGQLRLVAPSIGAAAADGGSLGGWSSVAGSGGAAGVAGIGAALGATALGAVAGTVIAGEYGVSDARERFAPSVGRARNIASTLRLGAGAGGVGSVSGFLNNAAVGRLTNRGIGTAQMAASYAAFVNGRGGANNGAVAQGQSMAGMEEALLWGTDSGMLGQMAAGGATGMSGKMAGAGLRGNALNSAMGALAGTVGNAASHGLSYDADAYASYARRMSSSVGGGMYGGALTAQRMAGAGGGLADSMRGNLSSMADMAVLAAAAEGGGDYMDIQERMTTMSPAQKAAAMERYLGSDGAKYAKFGLGESKARAGARPGADPGAATPGFFNDVFGRLQEGANLSVDQLANQSGSMAERIVQMDATTQANLAQIVEHLAILNGYLDARKAALKTVQEAHPTTWSWFGGNP